MDDAPFLYQCRRADEAGGWYRSSQTSFHQHAHWLAQRIENPLVEVLIWGDDEGMVRIDSNGELAFHGDDLAMLAAVRPYAASYGGRLKATVDVDDPNALLLVAAGFTVYPCHFLAYKA